jgi:signal transduction histidine kinase
MMCRVRGRAGPARRGRRWPAAVAAGLMVLGIVGAAARLDAPADGSVLEFGGWSRSGDGVTVSVPQPEAGTGLRTGDVVTAIEGHRLADGPGVVAEPALGAVLDYTVRPDTVRPVRVARPDGWALLSDGWGNLIFVVALGALATALYVRRPDEPATPPLLVASAGLFGSTVTVVAGLSALGYATAGPLLWLFHLNVVGAYSVAWGAVLALALVFTPGHPWLARGRRRALAVAYAAPLVVMGLVAAVLWLVVGDPLRRFALLDTGQTVVAAVALLVGVVAGAVAYRRCADPLARARLRWVAGGGAVSVAVGLAGWTVPGLIDGVQPLPPGAFGLSGLPFVVGLAVALRRHRLFDIDRLVNRSLVYASVIAVLVGGYAGTVALLASVLGLSNAVAAALAATAAALVLAPLRAAAQGLVNRLMYGQRDDPAGVLADLGRRLQGVLQPDDVPATVVATVTGSLRVPFAALDLADGDGTFRTVAARGRPAGPEHSEALAHLGEVVGCLRVSGRGPDDPLDPADLALLRSLAQQVGPAILAVRLHHDVLRSRAEVVSLREDERRRLRRDLHDGIGPSLAAIALKAGLAARQVPDGSAHALLTEIVDETQSSIADVRRVVDALRPPALDELGLIAALRLRADALSGELAVGVRGPEERLVLPAAVETAAYRIALEAMTNAVRHGGGSTCEAVVERGADELVVTVQDDGRGLPDVRSPGVGLRSMRERAAELGGTLQLDGRPGGGTSVQARLPLEPGGAG